MAQGDGLYAARYGFFAALGRRVTAILLALLVTGLSERLSNQATRTVMAAQGINPIGPHGSDNTMPAQDVTSLGASATAAELEAVKSAIEHSLSEVETLLNATYTDTHLETQVNAMCMHVINAGGKRIRPRIVLACAQALPNYDKSRDHENICHVAAAIEILHTATLVHDDVIDKAPMRRGAPTLHELEGNHAAILAGDYLFTRCFSLLHRPRNFDIISELSRTLSQLVIGELYQLEHEGDLNLSLETYYQTIYSKTSVLFELAASAAAFLVPESTNLIEPLKTYGRELGIAFQIADDILDYSANSEILGKDVGTDLADQRITLPVLLALDAYDKAGDAAAKDALIAAIKAADLNAVRTAIADTDAITKCKAQAQAASERAIAALKVLPESAERELLASLALKAIARNH